MRSRKSLFPEDEINFDRQIVYEEDTCHYRVYFDPPFSRIQDYQDMLKELEKHANDVYIKDYIWQDEGFNLELVIEDSNNLTHFHGSTSFGDNIEDEWFIVYILKQLSAKYKDMLIQISDMDGEFLLIESSNFIPKWLTPNTCCNRIWIFQNSLHIIPREMGNFDSNNKKKNISSAILIVRNNPARTIASDRIQESINKRISACPTQVSDSRHVVTCYLPVCVAYILKKYPQMISKAVDSFYLRDPINIRKCNKMQKFGAGRKVNTSVVFSRFLYAKLSQQKWFPPREYGIFQTVKNSSNISIESFQLGAKIAFGMEIYYREKMDSYVKTNIIDKYIDCYEFEHDNDWKSYLQNLDRLGYFEDSKKRDTLMRKARIKFLYKNLDTLMMLNSDDTDNPVSSIDKLLESKEFKNLDIDTEFSDEKLLPASENTWMYMTPDELDAVFLKKRQEQGEYEEIKKEKDPSLKPGLFDLEFDKVNNFIESKSGLDGVVMDSDNSEDDEFYRIGGDDDSDSQSQDENEVFSEKTSDFVEIMKSMDSQLLGTAVSDSFKIHNDQVDEKYNLFSNFSKSYSAQNGCPGPVQVLLSQLEKSIFSDDQEM